MITELLGRPGALLRACATRVDVWRFSLAAAGHVDLGVLSAEERARAARMRFGGERWSTARATLRHVLGRYLDTPGCELAFVTGAQGKPALAPCGTDLRFSLSHSDDVGLLAVRLGHDVGADVEHVREDVDGESIARSLFTPRERAMMAALTDSCPRDAFFRTWVRREAFAKATGVGVALPGDCEVAGYTVRELHGIPGCAAAVASWGTEWTVAVS